MIIFRNQVLGIGANGTQWGNAQYFFLSGSFISNRYNGIQYTLHIIVAISYKTYTNIATYILHKLYTAKSL